MKNNFPYLFLIFILFENSTLAQKRYQKIINAVIVLNNNLYTEQDHISDTLIPFTKYCHFDLEHLQTSANNYKHDLKKELYTEKEYNFLLKQIQDTSYALMNSRKIKRIKKPGQGIIYIQFTKPIFFPNRKKLIISYWKFNCPRCELGYTLLLEKKKGKWLIEYELGYWIQ